MGATRLSVADGCDKMGPIATRSVGPSYKGDSVVRAAERGQERNELRAHLLRYRHERIH
ncbi:hypothetical protein EV130_111122 [Rhizobium azibense]|uniref:Uncharacterized protein n=1 Tax=Rhizobium azibense TaxID=1136135 RepID=A0A4V2VAJ5_9HYPH|nr:hypothetical protein EV130_111122 [Rhizobium azibense]